MEAANEVGIPQPPGVAVVITTYNHAHFLLDAIQSVLAQTTSAEDILVVDDGSSDDPAAVVAQCAGVRLIRQPNRGLAAARNTGLGAVRSTRVIFLDADDRLLPNAIASNLACFAVAPGSAFVYGGFRYIDQKGRAVPQEYYHPVGPEPYVDMLKGNIIGMHGTVMYARAKLVEVGGFDPRVRRCEDYEIFLRMTRSMPIASHPAVVAEYRWHGNNMSLNHREMLAWALRVHDREAARAAAGRKTAAAWQQGRRTWRTYYAQQMLGDIKERWTHDRSLGQATLGLLRATTASPPVAVKSAARVARRYLIRRLPASVRVRLKAILGDRSRPALGAISFGDLDRTAPVSANFGFDRGTPIDRYYIERFLQRNAADIAGRSLEVGDDTYCRQFGGARVTRQDILHVSADNPAATIVGDLSQRGTLSAETFDCLVLTQTLHLIFDMPAAIAEMHRALKPGGVLLLTVPGISQVDRDGWGHTWFWSLTPASASRLFSTVFGADNVRIESHGNVYAATAFLHGLAVEEVDTAKLEQVDTCYPVIVTVRAQKRTESEHGLRGASARNAVQQDES